MNDPMKYLVTGAAIAIVSGAVGTMGGVWLMKEMGSSHRPEIRSQKSGGSVQPSAISLQPAVASGQSSVFSGQRMVSSGQRTPVITIPPKPSDSNMTFRPSLLMGKTPISYNQFQKAQELPEVKAAREAFMEAQKRYSEAMKKAMGQAGSGRSEMGDGSGGGKSKVASQGTEAKGIPLTIQVPVTNGAVRGK